MYIGVDVGGTFTDIALNPGDGSEMILHKLPSTPDKPEQAVIQGGGSIFCAAVSSTREKSSVWPMVRR